MLSRLQLRELVLRFKTQCGDIPSANVTSVVVKNDNGKLYVNHEITMSGVITIDEEPPDEPVFILKEK